LLWRNVVCIRVDEGARIAAVCRASMRERPNQGHDAHDHKDDHRDLPPILHSGLMYLNPFDRRRASGLCAVGNREEISAADGNQDRASEGRCLV